MIPSQGARDGQRQVGVCKDKEKAINKKSVWVENSLKY